MEKIVVTGGAGFIGSHIVDELLAQGFTPVVIDNMHMGKEGNIPSSVKLYKEDITNKEKLLKIFESEKPSYVVHCAAQTNIRFSLQHPDEDARNNIIGMINVILASKHVNVKKIIYLTSGGTVYGDTTQLPTQESRPVGAISAPYGISKYIGEKYLEFAQKVYDIDCSILRLANVYGPRQDAKGESGVISIFVDLLKDNKTPTIFGDGEQTRDFIYVTDVAKVVPHCIRKKSSFHIFNIGTAVPTSVNALYTIIAKSMHTPIQATHGEKIKGEPRHSCLDYSRAHKEFEWKPLVSIEEGLKNTVEWALGEEKQ
jgi:UDP-glucose 4-epimerase